MRKVKSFGEFLGETKKCRHTYMDNMEQIAEQIAQIIKKITGEEDVQYTINDNWIIYDLNSKRPRLGDDDHEPGDWRDLMTTFYDVYPSEEITIYSNELITKEEATKIKWALQSAEVKEGEKNASAYGLK